MRSKIIGVQLAIMWVQKGKV